METKSQQPDVMRKPSRGTAAAEIRRPANKPQLSLDEMQQLKWLLGGVLTLLSAWTVFYLDIDAWVLMALTSLGVVTVLVRPELPGRIPRWVHRLAFPFIVAFFIGDLWLTSEALPAMVRLDILLLLYRGVTYRQKRDDLQVIVLGLFLIVIAGVLTVSLTFAAQILAFTACALVFLLVVTLVEAAGAGVSHGAARSSAAPESERIPGWARHVAWRPLLIRMRQAIDWRVAALGGGLFLGLVAVSVALFLTIPRFQLENSLALDRLITKKAKTGFSDTIRFGDVTDIQQDTSVAVRVDVTDRSQMPASPYWRMLVLDDYHEGTFRLSSILQRDAFRDERTGMLARGRERERSGDPVTWVFYLESGVSRFLPLLGEFDRLQFSREPQSFRVGRHLGVVALRNEPVTMTAYRVEGMDVGATMPDGNFAARLRKDAKNPREREALMLGVRLEEHDRARLEHVANEIAGGAKLPAAEFAQRAGDWLARHHAYSLQAKIPGGAGDALVRWLTSDASGHCELFASSLVMLARSAGIPARIVTGFHGGSWNGYSNNFTLRNSDAHAWCELFDGRSGAWLRADPTPGANVTASGDSRPEVALARRTDRSWRARLESLRVFWYRRIVSFDQQSQMETFRAVKDATENSSRRAREAFERMALELKSWFASPWNVRRVAETGGALVSIGLLLWAAWNFRLSFFIFRLRSAPRLNDAVRAEAGRWLARIVTARADNGNENEAREKTIAELQRLRFGPRETWNDAAGVFRRARKVWREGRRLPKARIGW